MVSFFVFLLQNCRNRRLEQKDNLESVRETLLNELKQVQEESRAIESGMFLIFSIKPRTLPHFHKNFKCSGANSLFHIRKLQGINTIAKLPHFCYYRGRGSSTSSRIWGNGLIRC